MTDVPFWLQVLAIALAPGLGFLGVTVGVVWQSRNERYLALRAQRERAYTEFFREAVALSWHFRLDVAGALRTGDAATIDRALRVAREHHLQVINLSHQVEMIGSPEMIQALREFKKYLALAARANGSAVTGGYNDDVWTTVKRHGRDAIRHLRAAAAKDLGVRDPVGPHQPIAEDDDYVQLSALVDGMIESAGDGSVNR